MKNSADPGHRGPLIELGRLWRKPTRKGLPHGMVGVARPDPLAYIILPRAERAIEEHAVSSVITEIGGLLIGDVYEGEASHLVLVTEALPACHTDGSSVHVRFTGETWLELNARRRGLEPKMTVGWYHSHPGFGVFLSPMDSFVHRSFFGDMPWYLALVVDPISGQRAAFDWHGHEAPRVGYPGPNLGSGDERL